MVGAGGGVIAGSRMSLELMAPGEAGLSRSDRTSTAHVVVLMNFLPPHQLPVLNELARRVGKLTVLISTPMEPNRTWDVEWGDLDVQVQKSMTWRRIWRHPFGFSEDNYVHIPWDTLLRLRKLAPDVILSGELGMRSVFSALYARFAKKTRLVLMASMSEHTEHGRSRARVFLRKLLLRQCQCLVVNGNSGVRYVQSLGLDRSRIVRCSYAAKPHCFEQGSAFRSPEKAHRLLYLGQFVERKGLIPFLNVLRDWAEKHPDRRVEFDLIGKGPQQPQIERFAMPPNVHMNVLPPIPYDELPNAYLNGGILVFPTLADEWGMVVNEAFAAGVPVLGSRYAQAMEDLCVEGVNGWLFRPDKADEMWHALDAAMATSWEDLNTMRAAARDAVAGVTPQWVADVWCQAIERALNED
jgi:glycosyltransferase involved in cell wall biosynthesis